VGVLEPFLSFLVAPQTRKAHNMLDPHFKGLGLVIQYVGKERVFQVVSDHDIQVLFLLLVCAFKVLNLTNASESNAVVLHPKVSNVLLCMMLWIWMRIWHC
jgi:hypothetical protein